MQYASRSERGQSPNTLRKDHTMKNSWKLGKIAGIDVHIHWTFFLLPAFVALSTLASGGGFAAATAGVLLVSAVFGCVVLHELGHALAARRYGIGTHDITLLPIGGVARLERIPEKPSQEIAVALAGPAVNVVIAALLWLGLAGLGGMTAWLPALAIGGSFVAQLLWINIVLVAFNLLPAFPMDGGRVLRALLATRLPRVRATRIAATVAQVFAVGFGVLGLFGNPMLILIAVFVFMAARAEAEHVEWAAEEQATSNIRALPADSRVIDAGPLLFEPGHQLYDVVRGNEVVGALSKSNLLRMMCAGEGETTLADAVDQKASSTVATTNERKIS
jgi:Zn-dependent protease